MVQNVKMIKIQKFPVPSVSQVNSSFQAKKRRKYVLKSPIQIEVIPSTVRLIYVISFTSSYLLFIGSLQTHLFTIHNIPKDKLSLWMDRAKVLGICGEKGLLDDLGT